MIPCLRPARGSDQWYRGTSTTTLCPETSIASGCSGNACFATGGKRLSVVVKDTGTPGSVVSSWPRNGFLNLVCSIPGPWTALPPLIQDRSRMR
jgi:hypothetical protein